jgi:hypothetical protein
MPTLQALVKNYEPEVLYQTAVEHAIEVENPASPQETLAAGKVHCSHVPFGKVYANGAAFVDALNKGDAAALATALDILSVIDAEATVDVARAWFAAAPTEQQGIVAGFALGRSKSDAALDALLVPLESGEWDGTPYAVFEPNAHPALCLRMLALVSDWIASENDRAADGLAILGIIRDARAIKPIAEWLEPGKGGKGDVAVRAARALGNIGGDEAQAALARFVSADDDDCRAEVLSAIARAVPAKAFDVLAAFITPDSPSYDAGVAKEVQELVAYDRECRERGWTGECTNVSLDPRWIS